MAFLKYANAGVVKPAISMAGWDEVRSTALALGSPFDRQAAVNKVVQKYDPKQFMLSHCTIIASVDTENTGLPTGRQMVDGMQIDRRYSDFFIAPKTAKFVNNNCFVAGTLILMADGTEKPIEEVAVGDRVISHTGVVRKVVETFVHPFKGQLRCVTRLGDTRALEVSAEHPFFAMTPAMTCACGCGTSFDRRNRKAALHRFQDYVRGHGAKPRKNAKPDFGWVSAGLLEKGDFLSTPRLQGEVQAEGVTLGKARLLGYYLAEGFYWRQKAHRAAREFKRSEGAAQDGSSFPVAVSFALNLDESDTLVSEIQRLLKEEFGVGSFVQRVSEGGVAVHSHQSLELVRFFQKHATEYAKTKKVAEHVLQWPPALQREIVQGWIEGDGCVQGTAGGWVAVTSASPDLISQMHVVFGRLGVFATRGVSRTVGRKRVRVANGGARVVNDETKVCVSYKLQIGSVHAEKLLGGSYLEALFRRSTRNRKKHTLNFRVRDDRTMFPIRSVAKKPFEGKVYNFETEVDHSYVANGVAVHNSDSWERRLLLSTFRTFVGGENYVEHLQIPELSKGKIIDAAARDIGESIYVDILVATDLRHQPLVRAIQSGQLQTLSMGCQVAHTTCTKCGNVAEDETQLCKHIRYLKGNTFIDGLGVARKIAELCGHYTDPRSNKFIEASWVANPAFTGAVLRNILSPEEKALLSDRLQIAMSMEPRRGNPNAMQRAARLLHQAEQKASPHSATHNLGVEQTHNLGVTPVAKSAKNVLFGEGFGEEFEGSPEAEAPKTEENPIEKAVSELADLIREKALSRVRQEMSKGEVPRADLAENRNETLIREAVRRSPAWRGVAKAVIAQVGSPLQARRILHGLMLHKSGGWPFVQAVKMFSGPEMLDISRFLDQFNGTSRVAGEERVYRTVTAVGGVAGYADVESYLAACRRAMGRDLTGSERDALVAKGRIYDLAS